MRSLYTKSCVLNIYEMHITVQCKTLSVTNNMSLLFFSNMCLPYAFYFYLSEHEFTSRNTRVTKHMLNMCLPHGKHAFTSYLQHVKHAVHAWLHHLLILFKPVDSGFSLAFHQESYNFLLKPSLTLRQYLAIGILSSL
jgi:hypothetical protein